MRIDVELAEVERRIRQEEAVEAAEFVAERRRLIALGVGPLRASARARLYAEDAVEGWVWASKPSPDELEAEAKGGDHGSA